MVRLVPLALAFVFVASSAFAQGAVDKGKQVYAAQKCQICHSIGDVGNKKGPLDKVGSKLSQNDIREWIIHAPDMMAKTKAERKPAMKAYASLSKDEVDGLVAYMASLK